MQTELKDTTQPFPDIHYVAGNVYAKLLIMENAGDYVISHEHNYDHLSLLATGHVRVTVDDVATVYTAPTAVTVKAGAKHKIEALSSNVLWYCVHAIPADLVDESEIHSHLIRKEGDAQ
jgi:quercetin dioxygenase-like cupin family protein